MRFNEKGLPADALHGQLQAGQALLIVILVMTIALTIGLSVATRTLTNVRTTVEEENSQRAFSAAEAGIEQSMQSSSPSAGLLTNNTSFQATVVTLAGQEFVLNNGTSVLKDDAVDLWLSVYPGFTSPWSGDVSIYWGAPGNVCNPDETINNMAALEIVVIRGTKTSPLLTRYGIDPCAARRAVNNFTAATSSTRTIQGKTFAYRHSLAVTSGMIVRIIPLYAPTMVAARGCNAAGGNCQSLPVQGKLVTSVGISDTTQRKLVGFQEYPKLPVQIFPFLIFSPK